MGSLKTCDLCGSKKEEKEKVQGRKRKRTPFLFHIGLCSSVFVTLPQTGTYLGRGTSIDNMPPADWHMDKYIGHFLD